MFHDYLRGSLEALLFAAGEPLSVAKLAEIMQLDKPQVWELLSLLERKARSVFKKSGRRLSIMYKRTAL